VDIIIPVKKDIKVYCVMNVLAKLMTHIMLEEAIMDAQLAKAYYKRV
jgi:hypothetical protein